MSALRSGQAAWRRWSGQTLEERDPARDRRERLLLLIAAAFIFVNAVAYSLVNASAVRWAHLYAPLVWLLVVAVAHLALGALRPRRDPFLLPTFALLAGWGLLLQDRLAPNFLGRQTLWFALATAAMLLVAVLPRTLQPLMRYRYSLLLGGMVLLAFSLIFGVNPSGSGAALWLPVPFPIWGTIYFQPSELLKLLLVVFLASYFTEQEPLHAYRRRAARRNGNGRETLAEKFRRHLPFLGPLFLMWGFTLLLLVWQQDLGAAALFFIVFVALLYLATGEKFYVWSGLVLLFLAGVIAFYAFDTVVAPRVLSWINPWPNVSDRAYQIVQALYAQAAGGIFGQGIGQGYPDFIPVVHSDFVLAAISEEWGLIGGLAVVACFALLAARGLRAAIHSLRGTRPRFYHSYLAAGIVALFSVQTFLIMGGVTRLLPLTGITLPFVSYGGSSLMISSVALGLLLFLSAETEPVPAGPAADRGLARRIARLGNVILALSCIVALTLAYWSVARSDALLVREDNPRRIEAERRVQRGAIHDREGRPLAQSFPQANGFARHYTSPAAAPVVGYTSLRFGAAGIEAAFNDHLSGRGGNFWSEAMRRLLHVPVVGGDVELTLDASLQEYATALMSSEGAAGGLVLLELDEQDGRPLAAVRAMSSLPGFDPNRIEEEFEVWAADEASPLVNRATQGRYQPGLILQPLITAAAVDQGLVRLDDPLADPFLPVAINEQVLRCARPRAEDDSTAYTWGDMGALRCPSPIRALGEQLGSTALEGIFTNFGLNQTPNLPIPAESNAAPIADAGLAAIGEEELTVSPLQAALATAALTGDGLLPAPHLVDSLIAPDGSETPLPPALSAESAPVLSSETAAAIRAGWPVDDGVASYAVTVLAGPGDVRNTWYLGFAPARNPRYVLAFVLEDRADLAAAEEMGRNLLSAAAPPPSESN